VYVFSLLYMQVGGVCFWFICRWVVHVFSLGYTQVGGVCF
jgi:hypothetical protein